MDVEEDDENLSSVSSIWEINKNMSNCKALGSIQQTQSDTPYCSEEIKKESLISTNQHCYYP